MKVTLQNVRLAFPDLWEARAFGDGEPRYGASFLMDPKHPGVAALEEAFRVVAQEKWGEKAAGTLKAVKAADKTCLHDGDVKADLAGYPGNLYLSARSNTRPLVIDRDKTPLVKGDGRPYSGCYVNIIVDVWAQDSSQYGKRVNASLSGVQFFRDGEAFAGGVPAGPDDFAVVEEESLV